MHTFFHGWRRKAGCITLVMALALTCAWIRSYALFDIVYFATPGRSHAVVSTSGKLCWVTGHEGAEWFEWYTLSKSGDDGGIEAAEAAYFGDPSVFVSQQIISYWIPTLPLTLLSAYLIFWKPRKRD
ncbi:MAG: hypothetical protein JWP89_1013 [Schlesneria sp.]|nr:hypothetical protein [Schlesneria sp.]